MIRLMIESRFESLIVIISATCFHASLFLLLPRQLTYGDDIRTLWQFQEYKVTYIRYILENVPSNEKRKSKDAPPMWCQRIGFQADLVRKQSGKLGTGQEYLRNYGIRL